MPHFRSRIFVIVLLSSVVAVARADEGRVPVYGTTVINQPGAYVVTRSFSGQVQIHADDVTLDLNGRTITGTGSLIWVDAGKRRITIRNGALSGGTNAIYHVSATAARAAIRLEDLVVEGSTNIGVYLHGIERVDIRRCTVASTGGTGIYVNGGAGVVAGAIDDNVVRSTAGDGIFVNGLAAGQIRHNRVTSFTGSGGIHMMGSVASPLVQGGNVVDGNTIGNGGSTDGIRVTVDSPGNLVSGNTVTNSGNGIYLLSSGNRVTGNVCRNNASDGIELPSGPAYNYLDGNQCTQNAGYGIRAGGTSNRYRDCMLLGNTLGAAIGGGDAGGNITS